jgi:hypothetical protein
VCLKADEEEARGSRAHIIVLRLTRDQARELVQALHSSMAMSSGKPATPCSPLVRRKQQYHSVKGC